MSLLPVADALARITDQTEPLSAEELPLHEAADRILAKDITARLSHPPYEVSAMDGYAVRAEDIVSIPATLTVIGESAAGHAFDKIVGSGEAARIFTGAPLPEGTDTIVIQENTSAENAQVTINEPAPEGNFVKAMGLDFQQGQTLLTKGTRLTSRHLSLAAAMNYPTLPVTKKPVVAIIATGDELLPPGASPATDQIISSSPYGVSAIVSRFGGIPLPLGIAKDTETSLHEMMEGAKDADIVVTIGGASTGDHDLVHGVLTNRGVELGFWKIAMRPGKPLMFGRQETQKYLGLPGHPVSAMICARVFLVPAINRLTGTCEPDFDEQTATLTTPLEANGPRRHYMRGMLSRQPDGTAQVTPAFTQDSSVQTALAKANCLIIREPDAPALDVSAQVTIMPIDF